MALETAFFVGSDITSHMVVNAAVRSLSREADVRIHLFYTYQKANSEAPPDRRRLFFVEHELSNSVLYPLLDAADGTGGEYLSPEGLARRYPDVVRVDRLGSVNSAETVAELRRRGITVGFSVRCYQKFGEGIIGHFATASDTSCLLNLHPGVLPGYRGVLTYARAMANNEEYSGFTLHHINTAWDAGDIVSGAVQPLLYDRSVLENMLGHHRLGAALVHEAVSQVKSGMPVPSVPQNENAARYYTHLTPEELRQTRQKGIELYRADAVVDILSRSFGGSEGVHADDIRKVLTAAATDADRLAV
ncbi:formyltransferase family protein [Streptomyces silvisoli]|uniref:Formyltransferase family protein n=1 Tax=Streptomyces silvisoli TaxID=3034235 RepID=A0ABT5ZPC3_9ACTN|nr:formyltransferase family protein [Streptomyces silvisoli]MDF3291652.1 formyltransferase family protein [Streptomyces silvisoli]